MNATRKFWLDTMRETRTHKPVRCNWLLFSAMIECLLHYAGAPDWDPMRVDYALMKHAEWYKGDGWYHDGVAYCLENKLMQGDEDKMLNPDNAITRAKKLLFCKDS